MYRNHSGKSTKARSVLALLVAGALGLAASPAALANDRGGPGQPGAQQAASDRSQVLPRGFLTSRSVSWSD
jgi:hypothetical protein